MDGVRDGVSGVRKDGAREEGIKADGYTVQGGFHPRPSYPPLALLPTPKLNLALSHDVDTELYLSETWK